MRYARVLFLLAMVMLMPATLSAAPRNRAESPRLERVVKVVKRFIATIQSRITVPVGSPEEPPPDTEQG